MRIARESIWIAAIGLADLITTIVWVHYHGAHEANPVFAHYLRMGVAWFALMKVLLLAGPIFILEWARQRRPRFTLRASRFAIGAYCGMYVVGFFHLNPDMLRPASAMASVRPAKLQAHMHALRRGQEIAAWKAKQIRPTVVATTVAVVP